MIETIYHISDTHGTFPKLGTGDVIVHSGDFMANGSRNKFVETTFQATWLESRKQEIQDWIGDRPFLFVPGNHDFIDPVPTMKSWGIDAIDLRGHTYYGGLKWYGFEYTKHFTGEWNNEVSEQVLETLYRPDGDVDVHVLHSPLFGILDRNLYGDCCGSKSMLVNFMSIEKKPELVLHGHIHEAWGITLVTVTNFSNAATKGRTVYVK